MSNNLLDLYEAYMNTKDLIHIEVMVLHPHTKNCTMLFTRKHSNTMTLEEVQSELFIRLTGRLHKTLFDKEYKLKAYIKQIIRGIILDNITRDSFKKNVILTDNINNYDTYTVDTYECLEEFPKGIQDIFNEHPFTYDYLVEGLTVAELQKKYNLSYRMVIVQLREDEALIKEYYEHKLK